MPGLDHVVCLKLTLVKDSDEEKAFFTAAQTLLTGEKNTVMR